ncbi:MAG: methyl-accepting chemotaxis protein [Anaeromyxobacter sp.]
MARMRLGTRLTLAFTVLLVLLLGLGAMAVERVRRVHAALDEVSRVHSAALQLAGRGLVLAQRSSTLIDEALLEPEPVRAAAALRTLDENRQALDRLHTEVEAVVREGPEREAYQAVLRARLAHRRAFAPAGAALVAGDHAGAAELIRQDVLPARHALVAAWQGFMDAERSAIRAGAAVGQQELDRARRDLATAVLVAGLVGAGLALAVIRRIGPALEQAARAATEMAQGDLRHPVEVTRSDELGQLQRALGALQARVAEALRAVQADADALDGSAARLAGTSRALSDAARGQAERVAEAVVALHRVATGLANEAGPEGEHGRATWDEVRRASRLLGQLDGEVRGTGEVAAELAGAGEALSGEARALHALVDAFRLPAIESLVEVEVQVARPVSPAA